ncbi:hypothetical protein IGI04_038439 [Brassica rapa subsp. trilocularis]|uniref:non-specific serine/threonine protein kinase n=1 Tax=Brassica rapa subsp. trilocularis TaxID=1813537 RepID=A0ABQ7LNA8_BRACM|nr:hypothetical protein IGI04_038439 [Brassica rapa subsp. trilocularis]
MGNCNVCVRPPNPEESKPTPKPKKTNQNRKLNPFTSDFIRSPVRTRAAKDAMIPTSHQTKITDKYILGRELGRGEFGITYLCTDRESREALACKSISKRKLRTAVDVEDVRREPENFLFANKKENSALKAIDFGLSVFFKPGEKFKEIVGSPYYMAPEVLKRDYGPEVDVWSAGVIIYILLCGVPPFWAETEQGVALAILRGVIDFKRDPWPQISESAKSLVRQMLNPDPTKRLTAQQVLAHPWVQNAKKAPNVPLGDIVRSRLKQFSMMNRFKKKVLRVIAEHLSIQEVEVIKDMFSLMDEDNDGRITYLELKAGLQKVGSQLGEPEIKMLMEVADVDGNGFLDYGEFVAVIIHLQKIENDELFKLAFMFFDKDGSTYIELDELREALTDELGEPDVSVLNDIMREVDSDKDGRINYDEFVTMMKAGTDWRKASRQYSRERFKSLSINLMKDGSLHLHDALTGQSVPV